MRKQKTNTAQGKKMDADYVENKHGIQENEEIQTNVQENMPDAKHEKTGDTARQYVSRNKQRK